MSEKSYFDKIECVQRYLSVEDSLEWAGKIEELYRFLRGIDRPKEAVHNFTPKLSHNAATHLIWFLQEFTRIIPSQFQFCAECDGDVYDSNYEGYWSDIKGKGYCDNHAWGNEYIAFCVDCNSEVPLERYSKRYSQYLCNDCRNKRHIARLREKADLRELRKIRQKRKA